MNGTRRRAASDDKEKEKEKQHLKPLAFTKLPPTTQPAKSAKRCSYCNCSFTIFGKKVNCGNCGQVFCSKCTLKKTKIPHYNPKREVRVCDPCFLSVCAQYKRWSLLKSLSKEVLMDFLDAQSVEYDHDTITKTEAIRLVQQTAIQNVEEGMPAQNSPVEYAAMPRPVPLISPRLFDGQGGAYPEPSPRPIDGEPPAILIGEDYRAVNRPLRSVSSPPAPPSTMVKPEYLPPVEQQAVRNRSASTISNVSTSSSSFIASSFDTPIPPPARELKQEEIEYVQSLPVRQLKTILRKQGLSYSDCIEKVDLEEKVKMCLASTAWKGKPLYRLKNSGTVSLNRNNNTKNENSSDREKDSASEKGESRSKEKEEKEMSEEDAEEKDCAKGTPTDNFDPDVCKICYEREINCVLLECGHLVSCIECGRQLRDCPICRRFITRIVETYKS